MEAASLNALVDTPELRKARGAFFTPPEVARYICEWAIRAPTDRVYEPSCGEADFLLAAGRRLRDLGAERVDGELLAGAELHEDSAREALAELGAQGMTADVTVSDFFDVELAAGSFDAVVGNPPYVRYQAFHGERAGQGASGRAEGRRAPDRPGELVGGVHRALRRSSCAPAAGWASCCRRSCCRRTTRRRCAATWQSASRRCG